MPDRPKKKTPPNPQKFDPPFLSGDAILQTAESPQTTKSRGCRTCRGRLLESGTNSSARPAKKERRRRIDPTTFEKQYTDDEIEFMNAMQHFKMQSGRAFRPVAKCSRSPVHSVTGKCWPSGLIPKGDEPTPRSEGGELNTSDFASHPTRDAKSARPAFRRVGPVVRRESHPVERAWA